MRACACERACERALLCCVVRMRIGGWDTDEEQEDEEEEEGGREEERRTRRRRRTAATARKHLALPLLGQQPQRTNQPLLVSLTVVLRPWQPVRVCTCSMHDRGWDD